MKDRWLQAINGHRDVGQTACPGRYLYAKIPAVRLAAQKIQDAAQTGRPAPPPPAPTPAPSPPPPVSPPYTGTNRSDPKCYPASISERSYPLTDASRNLPLLVPLQCLLKQQGLYRYAVTGKWDSPTVAGIHAFQTRVRHPVGSGVTRSDWTALLSAGNTGASLTAGQRGADVVRVQRALNAALSRHLAVTGVYNMRTRRAVGRYQHRVGIPATRVVATQTWSALHAGRR